MIGVFRTPKTLLSIYVTALDLPGGLLIYAQGEADAASFKVRHSGKQLEVAALDLGGTLDDVLARVGDVAAKVTKLHEEARSLQAAA